MPGPPVIEGALKNTINALAFGLICATLVVNFGKYFIPNFFPYMVGILIAIEVVLFSFDKPKENYDKFQAPGIRGKHTIEGAGSPQIMVSAPPGEDTDGSPRKRDRIKDKLKTKKDQKGRRESGVPGSPNVPGSPKRQSLVPPPSPGQEAMDGKDMEHEKGKDKSAEKERKKEEEKAKKKEKEEEKERQKAEKKEHKEKGKEEDAEKSEKGTWRKRKATKQDSV
ncbi:uncharacterized protein LOC144633016 [Oculina patagonica]